MVQAMIRISPQANQILNIVKARHNLKDKSQAIDLVVKEYGKDFLEPELRPEFIERMISREKEPTVKVDNFRKENLSEAFEEKSKTA
jgi:hypothetical protein